MNKKNAIDYYKIVKDSFPDSEEKNNNFFEYFESTWLSLDDDRKSKYNFYLWTYDKIFNFNGNKTKLISEDRLNELFFLLIIALKVLIIC